MYLFRGKYLLNDNPKQQRLWGHSTPFFLVQSQCAACLNILRAVRLHHLLPPTDLPRSLALFINMLQYTQLTPAPPIPVPQINPSFVRRAIFPLINYRLAPRRSFCLFALFLLIGDMLISVSLWKLVAPFHATAAGKFATLRWVGNAFN